MQIFRYFLFFIMYVCTHYVIYCMSCTLQVKNTRGFHFCQIASVDQLLKQLADDINRPASCKKLTELLLNSYYPQNVPEGGGAEKNQNQLQRCLLLIKENVVASVAFYGTFYQFASVGSAAKVQQRQLLLFKLKVTTFKLTLSRRKSNLIRFIFHSFFNDFAVGCYVVRSVFCRELFRGPMQSGPHTGYHSSYR